MAYDATLPANNSLISSSELRNQFNGLKTLVDDCITQANLDDAIQTQTPAPITSVFALGLNPSDPPTRDDVQAIADKLDQLIAALKR